MKLPPAKCMAFFAVLLLFCGNANAQTVLVVNGGNNQITEYNYETGAYLGLFTTYSMERPFGMTTDGNNVYIDDIASNTIEKFSLTGAHLLTFTSPYLSDDEGMVVSNGFLYAASYNNGTIEKFALDGTDLGVFATLGVGIFGNGGLQGMVADPYGDLFVADYNGAHPGTIQEVAPNGSFTQFATMSTPVGMAIDSSGNIYASDPIYGQLIDKFNSSGTNLGDIVTGQWAYYMTMGSNNVLYAPNTITNTIEMFSSTGTDLGAFTTTALDAPVSTLIIPEPSTWLLLVAGIVPLVGVRRRKLL